jgi:protein-disulfide isomerase
MSNQKKLFTATALVLAILFLAGAYFFRTTEQKKTTQTIANNAAALMRDYSPSKGSSLAKVSLVEFLDPECETCALFHPLVKDILKNYDGKIKYVVRYAPFHPNSKFIIHVLEAARKQDKYWETLDLLFAKLPEWGDHHNPQPEKVWDYLATLNLDLDKLEADMKDESINVMIEQEIKDEQTFGVQQTPSFFINGKPLQSFGAEQLQEAIREAMQ